MLNKNYGIKAAALAVKGYLDGYDGIESSWNDEASRYLADVKCAPWYNGREAGIVVYMRGAHSKGQLNLAIYEHRNSDNICVLMWEQDTHINPPCLANLPDGVMPTKWDYSKSFNYNGAVEAAAWVKDQLEAFWTESARAIAAAQAKRNIMHGTNFAVDPQA